MKKILIIVGGVLLLAGVAVGGVMIGRKSAPADNGEATVEEEIKADAGEGHGESAGHGEEAAADAHGAPADDGHGGGHGDAKAAGGTKKAESLIYEFDPITTNLSDVRMFAQLKIGIEATSAAGMKTIEQNKAPLLDATIMLLSGKTAEDMQSTAGLERLKRELIMRYEGVLNSNKIVRNVYLTDRKVVRN